MNRLNIDTSGRKALNVIEDIESYLPQWKHDYFEVMESRDDSNSLFDESKESKESKEQSKDENGMNEIDLTNTTSI